MTGILLRRTVEVQLRFSMDLDRSGEDGLVDIGRSDATFGGWEMMPLTGVIKISGAPQYAMRNAHGLWLFDDIYVCRINGRLMSDSHVGAVVRQARRYFAISRRINPEVDKYGKGNAKLYPSRVIVQRITLVEYANIIISVLTSWRPDLRVQSPASGFSTDNPNLAKRLEIL
ncbi:hypothetical protein M422DRAFT_43687 [Sphaerobolus stellatus SS14]|nr:hypothetical protein M422DRAFT_43687 [Sphaerobolus stellatus SS14]